MDSLESLPPEDSDVYIPNLSSVQTQYSTSSPTLSASSQQQQQSMQMSAIRYTSPAAAAVAGISPALVAAQGPNGVLHGFYRTTLTTQVIAAQTLAHTFQYPPTPPVDGSLEGSNGERRYLQSAEGQALTPSSQGVMDGEIPASAGYEKSGNPFPSPLPTPPDVQAMHSQQNSQMPPQEQSLQQQHLAREEHQPSATKGVSVVQPQQQWTSSSVPYFMPQTTSSHCSPLVPYNGNACNNSMGLAARRGCPPNQMPSLQQVYPTSLSNGSMNVGNVNCNDPLGNMGDMMKKMPAIPALVKDGKACCCFYGIV